MGMWSKSVSSTDAPKNSDRARPHLYLVPKEPRTGSLRDALLAAGLDPGPATPKPAETPEVAAARIAQQEGRQVREMAQRYAPERTGPALPDYWKSARRERWRGRFRDGVAWMATVLVIGSILAGAAIVLVGPALRGEKPFVAQQ